MISAIILAAGNSSRFGGDTPKQFLKINRKLLIDFSISEFKSIPSINKIIIVTSKKYHKKMKNIYTDCIITIGGKTRKESSYNGLIACPKNTKKVLIHDAARVLIKKSLIIKCIKKLDSFDAVTLGIPVKDTIAKFKNNSITKIDDREKLIAIQTPQGFDYKKIKSAHETHSNNYTDDIRLMLETGYQCKLIKGDEKNFKITDRLDFIKLKQILRDTK